MLYKKLQYNLSREPIGTKIAIAVSGGSDSIALLCLMHKFAKENDIKLFCFSVDHNLRIESKVENDYVKNLCNDFSIEHFQLCWNHGNDFSNIQARAREARYGMMTALCLDLDILTLMTAHHEDDYIENFCIRQSRKSSIFGLSSANITYYNNVRLLRPLYNITKQELIDYLRKNNIKWFEDESNQSNKYIRNIFRNELKDDNLRKAHIKRSQKLINYDFENEIRPLLIKAIAECVTIHKYGFATIDLKKFNYFPDNITSQIISYILIIISGIHKNTRYDSNKLICNLLKLEDNFTKTLHDCVIHKIGANLLIYKEFQKNNLPPNIKLEKGRLWDNRFRFMLETNNDLNNILPEIYITHLTIEDYREIKQHIDVSELRKLSYNNHIKILFTLPVARNLEKLVAIPHISYYNTYYNENGLLKVALCQKFISRFTHFC